MASTRSANFDGNLTAPALARHLAVEAIAARADVDALAADAVRAGASSISVSIEIDPHSSVVRFIVADNVDGWPTLHRPARDEIGGRGLPIVDALASAWGVERIDGAGKRVWATLPVLR